MRIPPLRLPATDLDGGWTTLVPLVVAATLLELAAGTGLAYVAGFTAVRTVLGRFDATWLIALLAALSASYIGYCFAYRGIFRVEGGPTLSWGRLAAVVAAGFGGFLAYGGDGLEMRALRAAGASEAGARTRVASLAGMEQGVLAIGGCGTAIAVLVTGLGRPSPGYTLPWAVLPVPGMLIAFWAAERYRARFVGRAGWPGRLGTFLDSIHNIRVLFFHPLRWGTALLGMALFWAGDAGAVWAGLAAFGLHMNAAAMYVGFVTGMVFTRRSGPLAGAGVLALVLPVTIWISGAPLPVAVAGVFVYRVLATWTLVPVSLAVLPTLRSMRHRPGEPVTASGPTVPEGIAAENSSS
jgi:hypothetical protein